MAVSLTCQTSEIVRVLLDEPVVIWDCSFALVRCHWPYANPYQVHVVMPNREDTRWVGPSGKVNIRYAGQGTGHIIIRHVYGNICRYVDITVERCVPPGLAFADVAISRRYGNRLYLSGKLEHVVDTDEICVLYSRPGDAKLLNLKGATVDYTYLKDAFGSLTFDTRGKYLEFTNSGYYILEAWDVAGDCETRSQKRASWALNVTQPKYQYQLYFDVDAPELGGKGYLLQAEWDKYNSWKPYRFTFEEPDCFPLINGTQQTTPQQVGDGWLCQAAEPLGSGCAPLSWWMCRSWTNWDIYMRGECSCDHFQNTLKPLGIPCHHLIAMYEEYGSEPPYCGYVKCP